MLDLHGIYSDYGRSAYTTVSFNIDTSVVSIGAYTTVFFNIDTFAGFIGIDYIAAWFGFRGGYMYTPSNGAWIHWLVCRLALASISIEFTV